MIIVRTSNENQMHKSIHPIGRIYEGDIDNHEIFKTKEFPIAIYHKSYRKATQEEIDWYNQGARLLPKYKIGEQVQVILNSEDTLIHGVSLSQLDKINRIDNFKFNRDLNQYTYHVNGWHVAEENLKSIGITYALDYKQIHPITPEEAFKPFDKSNFYVYIDKEEDFKKYKELCKEYSISYEKGWVYISRTWYGVINDSSKYNNILPLNASIYNFITFKLLLTNKTNTNEVQEKITTEPRRITGQVYRQDSSLSKITSSSRFIRNTVSFSRGRAKFGKFKKLLSTIYSRNS